MDFMYFLEGLVAYQILFHLIDIVFGTWICFGALKWRKELLAKVAVCWGLVIGIICGVPLSFMINEEYPFFVCLFVGIILFPILTYTVPCFNRFTLGFIIVTKLTFMCTTVLWKNGGIDFIEMFTHALLVGVFVGFTFAVSSEMAVGPFVLACAFLGASEVAPFISKWINQVAFSITGDISYILDPQDFFLSLLKIEVTDFWTLLSMIILMFFGIKKQLSSIKAQGYSFHTPIIVYETNNSDEYGKIYPEK